MKPKKKSMFEPIMYVIAFVFAVFIAFNSSFAWEQAVLATPLNENVDFSLFLGYFQTSIAENGVPILFNEYSMTCFKWCLASWVLFVLAVENSRRNYIHGKEFGTSEWGKEKDIKDLFASNIAKEEIKNAKKSRFWLGRWFVKRKLLKACEADGKALYRIRVKELQSNSFSKAYREQKQAIKKEVAESVRLAKIQAWKPNAIKNHYEETLKEIDNPLYSQEEQKAKCVIAERKYKADLASFYKNKKKVEEINAKYKDADMLFTASERISFYNWKLNNNTLILGGSGSGKTRGYVMPNILQAHSSYIVTDPKGEILEKAGYFLKKIKGYKIRVLNLDEKTQSNGYNPFAYIHPEREGYEERVLTLIETIIVNTNGGENKGGSDPFWDKAEKLFLQALFFFTVDGFVEEQMNMSTVLDLIGMLQIADDEDNLDSDLDYFAKIFAERFGEEHIGVQQYREFREKSSGKTAKSIVISAVARLAPFRTSAVKKMFAYDTMQLDMVGEEKTAIFVVVPPTDPTFNFIAGMLFTQLFQELQYCATQVHKHDGQRLPVPCRFILDEFANTCKIPNFVKILAYARSFGIGITPILQSLEQIKNMYKDEWGVIIDNCNTLLYLGSISHNDTLDYMSKLIGKGTFDKRTTGHSKGRQGSSTWNFDVVGRELMDTAEIRKLPKSDCLFIVGGRNPFYSKKYQYENHPNYRYTSDGNKSYSYHYVPIDPEILKKQKEVFTHGEEETKPLVASEQTVIVLDTIKINTDIQNIVNRVGRDFTKYEPLDDGDMMVDDGEQLDYEAILNGLVDNSEDEDVQQIMALSIETSNALKQAEEEKISIETNPVKVIGNVVENISSYELVSDDEMSVDDGESKEPINQEFADVFVNSEIEEDVTLDTAEMVEMLSLDEMQDILNADIEDVQALISNDMDFLAELEEVV